MTRPPTIDLVVGYHKLKHPQFLRTFLSKIVFVHIGLSSLNEGQVVEYEEVSNRGKTSAENLRVQR